MVTMTLNPGSLDTPCIFKEESVVPDGMGGWTTTLATITGSPAWCRFEPLRGMENIEAGKVTAGHHAKITIRRCEDITPAALVDVMGERWNVNAVEDYGRQGWMVLWINRT
jgi:SPP1 family predicted phage head-tail adaptor